MSSIALALAERAVPRYTSYPTAPHFNAAIDSSAYEAWLSMLPRDATISLYIHVPYCAELCLYCGCHTKASRRDEPIAAYTDRLARELALVAARTGRRKALHLHWGGGTPSILGERRLLALTDGLSRTFDLAHLAEHAIELDPRRVTGPLVGALNEMGINRVSLGVQDFSPHVQEAIGRVQPFGAVEEIVGMLRQSGIGDINFDLMYGLPKQRTDDLRRTITLAAALRPRRIALFGYAHVPWFKRQQRLIDETTLPGIAERLRQAQSAREMLTGLGYVPVGLDHFAEPDDSLAVAAQSGRLRRNFQGYTVDAADALIGIGASAISHVPQGYTQNAPGIGAYSRAVSAGQFATAKGVLLTPEDRVRGRIIEQLMCEFEVDLGTLSSRADAVIDLDQAIETLLPLQDEGLVEIDGARIRLTEQGRPFARLIVAAFDSYLPRGSARHSLAV